VGPLGEFNKSIERKL